MAIPFLFYIWFRLNAVSLTGSFVLEEESFLFNPMFSWEFSIWTDGFRSLNENSSQLFDKRSHFFYGSFKKKNDRIFHFLSDCVKLI